MLSLFLELFKNIFPLFGYLKSQSFPQPLSKIEEEETLLRWQCKDLDARNTLIEHNLRLVAHIAKKYENKKTSNEDLISIGTLGLIKGIDTFKFDQDRKLATYIAKCIENEILMHLRTIKKTYNDISLSDPIGYDKDGNEIELIDVIDANINVNVVEQMYHNEQLKKLSKYLDTLDDKEREILTLRYGLLDTKVMTQRQIAKEKNISRSYVSRIEKRAFTKLMKKFIQDEELKP